jgi:hypothetical protein
MPTWLLSLIAVLGIVAASLIAGFINVQRTRRRLRELFGGRDNSSAISSCLLAFPDVEERRVRLAYRWVQTVTNYPTPPIQFDDRLEDDLRIDQGDVDAMLESSHEWRGTRESDRDVQSVDPLTTVKDLMAEVLAYQYEGYVDAPHKDSRRDDA